MELVFEFDNGEKYALVEYYDAENEIGNPEFGVEVWEMTKNGKLKKCLYSVPGASFLDPDEEDSEEYNEREFQFIQEMGYKEGVF